MKPIMDKLKFAALFVALAAAVVSCKKDDLPRDPDFDQELVINLEGTIISVNDVDSANVVFRKNGTGTPIFQRLIKGQKNLSTITDGMSTGQWLVEVDVYTKKDNLGKSRQYLLNKTITLSKDNDITEIKGPVALGGNDPWKPRAVLSTSTNEIVVLVPLDITDPYFEIRSSNPYWHFFGVERTAFSGNALVAQKTWSCQQGCVRPDKLLFDKDTFKPFTDKIKTNNWDRSEIIITVGNTTGQEYNEFSYNWQQ